MSSSQIVEVPIVSAQATVMIYDDTTKKWMPSGSSSGFSKVQLLQHQVNCTYRVVGRKIQDHEVVINCSILKGLKYNQANQTFLQWRDAKQVYGLNFKTKEEAELFTQSMKLAIDNLSKGSADTISLGKRSNADSNSLYDESDRCANNGLNSSINNNSSNNINTIRNVGPSPQIINTIPLNNNNNNIQLYQTHHRQSSDYNTSYQQQQQQQILMQQQPQIQNSYHDQNQKIYDVIPDTIYTTNQNGFSKTNGSGGSNGSAAPPPPPPPPPPIPISMSMPPIAPAMPSNNDFNMQSSQAAIPPGPPPPFINGLINNCVDEPLRKPLLKRVDETKQPQQQPPIDFLTELKLRAEKKNLLNAKQNSISSEQSEPKNSDDIDSNKFSKKPQINVGQRDSPLPFKKNPSLTTVSNGYSSNGNGYAASNGSNGDSNNNNNFNYDKLKQELLIEIKKEMQTMKTDIINALITELKRMNN